MSIARSHAEILQCIKAKPKLRKLEVANGGLDTLPDGLNQASLHKLLIFANRFTEMPSQIREQTKLRKLQLSSNGLQTLPPWLSELEHLKTLDLQRNALAQVRLSGVPKLELLELSWNPVRRLELSSLPSLKKLMLSKHELVDGPDLSAFSQLQELWLKNGPLREVPPLPSTGELRLLNLNANDITALPDRVIASKGLKDLRLGSNDIQRWPTCSSVDLQALHIEHMKLEEFPEFIFGCQALNTLLAKGNPLGSVPSKLGGLPLQYLDLSVCALSVIPPCIEEMASLRHLLLNNNAITEVALMKQQRRFAWLCALVVLAASCSSDTVLVSVDAMTDTVGAQDSDDASDSLAGPDGAELPEVAGDIGGDTSPAFGSVNFVPIYEVGSAWETTPAAQAMVKTLFAEFEARLRTAGPWDATIEIYLTDDNTGTANTTFAGTFGEATVNGQTVRVVPAWLAVVEGTDVNGPSDAQGAGAEFTVNFNVAGHGTNAGLLRHELMHGLGAVGTLDYPTVTTVGVTGGPKPGDTLVAGLYDLRLVDLDGEPLLGGYDVTNGTFEVQPFNIEKTLAEWMDGDGGVFFRGVTLAGKVVEMPCGTFPIDDDTGFIGLNEPQDLMSAASHPTWNTLVEPDEAFLNALGYPLAP